MKYLIPLSLSALCVVHLPAWAQQSPSPAPHAHAAGGPAIEIGAVLNPPGNPGLRRFRIGTRAWAWGIAT